MPELPEVQALASFLDARAGLRVARVDLAAISALKTFDPPLHALEGRVLRGATRRGKFLLVDFGDDGTPTWLAVHLARAGWLTWRDELPAGPTRPGKGPLALRVQMITAEGELAGGFDLTEAGTKKGLAVYVVHDPDEVPGIGRLGPEPLDPAFDVAALAEILRAAGGRQIKGVLRDQGTIAGIGNAYSDEVLHVARLSPFAAGDKLTDEQVQALHTAIVETLTDAVARSVGQGTGTLKAEKKAGMRVHGRTGQACPACGDVVREVSFSDRSLQYCPTCQTEGKPLSDRRMSRLLK